MNMFVDFKTCLDNNLKLGSKFENLALLSQFISIPKSVCIPSSVLNQDFYSQIGENADTLRHLFKELETTAACYLLDTYPQIDAIAQSYKVSHTFRSEFIQQLSSIFICTTDNPIAVRSSANHEDSSLYSFAGIYETLLNVGSVQEAMDFIEYSIIKYHSYTSLAARIRAGIFSPNIELNIIVQQMIKSIISGVTFTKAPFSNSSMYTEWVYGVGESLVSGEKKANFYTHDGSQADSSKSHVLSEAAKAADTAKICLNCETDIEWVYDGYQFYLLQARPITTDKSTRADDPIFQYDELYFDNDISSENKLFECKEVYQNYTSKRTPFYLCARQNAIKTGRGIVLLFNIKGLKQNVELLSSFFRESEKVIIDINNQIRQQIIMVDQMSEYLIRMYSNNEKQLHTVIIRQFIQGVCGCISRKLDRDSILIEYSKAGLLAMNRGIAEYDEIIISRNDPELDAHSLPEKCIHDIVAFTDALKFNKYRYMFEWAIWNGEAYFVDFSSETSIDLPASRIASRIVVPGNFSGPVITLQNKNILGKLSIGPGVSVGQASEILNENQDLMEIISQIKAMKEKPVIYSDKPYAILSFLFEYVSGFIFDHCAHLCHLSILLRENHMPAVIIPDEMSIREGDIVMVINGNIDMI
jgi:hypothetical protein